jgi:hypothetical protein
VSDPLAAGIHALAVPGLADGFAAVLGAHPFWHNGDITLPRLIEPLHQLACHWRRQQPRTWALVVHDWSLLSYPGHTRKTDQIKSTNGRGYELTTLLLVEGSAGDPIAPLELRLRSARGVFSTRAPAPDPEAFRIDEVLPSMRAVADLGLGERLVHVIDREADSLAPYRAWQADGRHFLVRAKGGRKVRWQGEELSLAQLAGRLPWRRCREVTYKGRQAVQHVAEGEVVLDRPAWRHRRRGGRVVNERVPGPPITLRLVVSRVCDGSGRTLAVWYLLTNVPAEVDTATVALWYYWRWRIEQAFKDVKEVWGGQQLLPNIDGNVGAFHLNLWQYSTVEAWAWARSEAALVDRRASPWDHEPRGPSHADKRKALRREVLRREIEAVLAGPPDPQRYRELAERLLELAA